MNDGQRWEAQDNVRKRPAAVRFSRPGAARAGRIKGVGTGRQPTRHGTPALSLPTVGWL